MDRGKQTRLLKVEQTTLLCYSSYVEKLESSRAFSCLGTLFFVSRSLASRVWLPSSCLHNTRPRQHLYICNPAADGWSRVPISLSCINGKLKNHLGEACALLRDHQTLGQQRDQGLQTRRWVRDPEVLICSLASEVFHAGSNMAASGGSRA